MVEKPPVSHILIKFTYKILRMRNYKIVASFITWIFINHVLIKQVLNIRVNLNIFFINSEKKEYNCPLEKNKSRKDQTFG
jgi:hypothetical protein